MMMTADVEAARRCGGEEGRSEGQIRKLARRPGTEKDARRSRHTQITGLGIPLAGRGDEFRARRVSWRLRDYVAGN